MKTRKGAIPYDDAMAKMYAKHPEKAVDILNICLEEGDMEMLLVTLHQISKIYGGVAKIAEKTGLNENTLYRTLSRKGNPSLKTLLGISDALGIRLAFTTKEQRVMAEA